jgi:hypothetical protein
MIQLPEPVQDIIVQLISTSGFGYVIVLLMGLWKSNPLLVAVPIVFLVVCVHFITSTSKSSSFLPATKEAKKVQPEAKEASSPDQFNERDNESTLVKPFNDEEEKDDDEDEEKVKDNEVEEEEVNINRGLQDCDNTDLSRRGHELSRLQYLLWGKDLEGEDNAVDSSSSDSDENCDEFFDKRREEMEVYMARSEAWDAGMRDGVRTSDFASAVAPVDATKSRQKGEDKAKSFHGNDHSSGKAVEQSFTGVSVADAVTSPPPPAQSSPTKSSPVAAAFKVNSRAGALKQVRRTSSIGLALSSPACTIVEESREDGLDHDLDGDEEFVDRILQRPKEFSRTFSPDEDNRSCSEDPVASGSPSLDDRFSRRSSEVKARLRGHSKQPDSSIPTFVELKEFSSSGSSFSSGSSGTDDDDSVYVLTKPTLTRIIGTVGSDNDSDNAGSKRFSSPSIVKNVDVAEIESNDLAERSDAMQRRDLASVQETEMPPVALYPYDPKNPFNLNASMFELSDDSDDS